MTEVPAPTLFKSMKGLEDQTNSKLMIDLEEAANFRLMTGRELPVNSRSTIAAVGRTLLLLTTLLAQ